MSSPLDTVRVAAERAYDVTVGHGATALLPALVDDCARVALLHPVELTDRAEALARAIDAEVLLLCAPPGERAKTAGFLADCWDALAGAGFTRSDAVVGFGGGATTDLAGFVAATWLRGIKVVHVPTTILAMVDAAVGGKTGINTAEGKNLVGAFYPPAGVLCDIDALETLPRWDFVAGLGEIVKCGLVADARVLDLIESNAAPLSQGATSVDEPVLVELIQRAVQWKADVVGEDLKESGLREILNYGHTFGHAIEHVERYQWRHGAAVSVGMVFAAELARLAGKLSDDDVARHRSVLSSLGLPLTYRGDRWDALLGAMRRDKKSRGDLLRFVVLDSLGHPTRLEGPDPTLLAAAYAEVSEDAPAGGRPVSL